MKATDPKRLAPARIPSVADRHFDYPGPYPLRQSYIIASTPRSGSTFLSSVLWQTGVLGAPTEYWNCHKRESPKPIGSRMMQRLEAASRSDYLKKLLACRTTKNGMFGVKVQFDDFEEMLRQFPEVLDRLSPVNYIYIERADKVAQAVSMAKAMQTGVWASTGGRQRSVSPAVYNKEMIARCLKKLEEQRFGWLRWFEANKIDPLTVSYEMLAMHPAATVRKIVRFLGAEKDRPQKVPIRMTEPQSDGTNKEWVTRFSRDMENVGAPGLEPASARRLRRPGRKRRSSDTLRKVAIRIFSTVSTGSGSPTPKQIHAPASVRACATKPSSHAMPLSSAGRGCSTFSAATAAGGSQRWTRAPRILWALKAGTGRSKLHGIFLPNSD